MWRKSSRRERHVGKHGTQAAAPPLIGTLANDPSLWLPVHARMFSETTEAWMRQVVESEESMAKDYETEGNALLEHAALIRSRVAEMRAYLDGASQAPMPATASSVRVPARDAEVKHWVDGAWQPVCGELSGIVAESRDAVTCAGCRYHIDHPRVDGPPLVDTGELRQYREETRPMALADVREADQVDEDAALYPHWVPAVKQPGDTAELARVDGVA